MEILLMNFIMNPHRIQIHMYIQLNLTGHQAKLIPAHA